MIEATKQKVAPVKSGKNPHLAEMEKHCHAIIKDAEKLASDEEKSAEFHELRAKELQGK